MTGMNENEEIVEAATEQVAEAKTSKAVKPKADAEVEATADTEATRADADVVYLSRCVFKNKFARKSFTIHHLQRRLHDLGFKDAYSDRDGWYGDLTAKSVREFQESRGLNATGTMDAETFSSIFEGDSSVVVDLVN